MAYNKKYPQIDESVVDYTKDQEDRIESEFDKRVDFVVEQGTNYTKWNSGKLEQWGFVDLSSSITNKAGEGVSFEIDKPVKPYKNGFAVCTPVLYDRNLSGFVMYEASVNLNSYSKGYYRIIKTTGGEFGSIDCGVAWSTVDRWK